MSTHSAALSLRAIKRPRRMLGALDSPSEALAHIGPNWFASVMGTGIVAIAATLRSARRSQPVSVSIEQDHTDTTLKGLQALRDC